MDQAPVVKLGNLILVKDGQVFSMAEVKTGFRKDDCKYSGEYLGATKDFFGKILIIVEEPGDALLLPTIVQLLESNFTGIGTSVVDIRSTGLHRYAGIFQYVDNDTPLENQYQVKLPITKRWEGKIW